MDWIVNHWAEIMTGIGLLIGVASFITGLTPTPVDDGVVAIIRRVFGLISAAEPRDAEGTFKLPGARTGPILTVEEDYETGKSISWDVLIDEEDE